MASWAYSIHCIISEFYSFKENVLSSCQAPPAVTGVSETAEQGRHGLAFKGFSFAQSFPPAKCLYHKYRLCLSHDDVLSVKHCAGPQKLLNKYLLDKCVYECVMVEMWHHGAEMLVC